jgi:antitoxin (DNA-binding transcriptional repressor) of toxin-antitoxin stability system
VGTGQHASLHRPPGSEPEATSDVLHLPHMETIGVRELQQRASAVLRRIERGEVLGVTERGRLVAVLGPPSLATGAGALVTAGRVRPARPLAPLPEPVAATQPIGEVLDELRADG